MSQGNPVVLHIDLWPTIILLVLGMGACSAVLGLPFLWVVQALTG